MLDDVKTVCLDPHASCYTRFGKLEIWDVREPVFRHKPVSERPSRSHLFESGLMRMIPNAYTMAAQKTKGLVSINVTRLVKKRAVPST